MEKQQVLRVLSAEKRRIKWEIYSNTVTVHITHESSVSNPAVWNQAYSLSSDV